MEESSNIQLSKSQITGFYVLWILGMIFLAFGFLVVGSVLIPDFVIGVISLFFGGFALGLILGFYVAKKLGIKLDTTFYGYR